MAEGVEDAQRSHCSAHDRQDFNYEVVEFGLVLAVDDVDGLDLGHEHNSFEGVVFQLDHS